MYDSGTVDAPDPTTWLWIAIGSTLCCCLPLGVVGIVYAALAKGARDRGDEGLAERYVRTARGWTIAAIVAGLVVIVCNLAARAGDSGGFSGAFG